MELSRLVKILLLPKVLLVWDSHGKVKLLKS